MATVHVARKGERLAERLSHYRIERFPDHGAAQVAAFVGEESDPLRGQEHEVEGQRVRTYTPWGKLLCWPEGSPGTITYARTTSKVLHQVALPCGRLLAIGPS